CAHPSSW
nr:immunoglobulin heavy chain junction region [Mus musculus]